MIEIKSLVKIYEDGDNAGVKAVNDISFNVEEGRFYTLLGPSGCGKTTTLRCIAGLEKANGGEILVAGKKVFSALDGTFVPAYRRPIGMVFQSYAIWPHMTVFENVAFPLRVGKERFSNADVKKKVNGGARPGGIGRLRRPHGHAAFRRAAATARTGAGAGARAAGAALGRAAQ